MWLGRQFTRMAVRPHLPRRTVRLRLTLLYGALFLASGAGLLAITYVLVAHRIAGPFSVYSPGSSAHPAPGPGAPDTATGQLSERVQAEKQAVLHQFLVQSGIALAIMAVVSIVLGWIVGGRVLRPLRTMTNTTRQISERNLHERLALPGPRDELTHLGDTIDGLLARLEGAFDAQRRFVANASHELRTPLTVRRALLQVALADPHLTLDSLRTTCQELLAAEDDQEQLIDALLTLARSQRGLDRREPLELSGIVDEVVHATAAKARTAGIAVHTDLRPARFLGDARLVARLVSNLVENALRYNVPDGQVEIAVASSSRGATLRVTNTGPPVPADEVERLLQPFQRLDPQRRGDHSGLGLGLSIVAAIAVAHHAPLNARPGRLGGLVVTVDFPLPVNEDGAVARAILSGS